MLINRECLDDLLPAHINSVEPVYPHPSHVLWTRYAKIYHQSSGFSSFTQALHSEFPIATYFTVVNVTRSFWVKTFESQRSILILEKAISKSPNTCTQLLLKQLVWIMLLAVVSCGMSSFHTQLHRDTPSCKTTILTRGSEQRWT
jgi:hypothetical protein